MINLDYASIDRAIVILSDWLGPVETKNTGRQIGMGAISKARWTGPGWEIRTDHFRTAAHATTIRAFLEFRDPHDETIFRLKHPDLCG
jgi:hypothetical protein